MSARSLLAILLILAACNHTETYIRLPFLGNHELSAEGDTLYYRIPAFEFTDQLGRITTQQTLAGQVYVADFFFTSCPTICPVMKRNMLLIYEEFKNTSGVLFVSHSIDPIHDSVPVLYDYAEKLGVNHDKWLFLTGDKSIMHRQAQAYMSSAAEDERAPGGYIHSGAFVLIDKRGHIRAAYDGTQAEEMAQLKREIKWLLQEDL
jgi:protein SCO1/2